MMADSGQHVAAVVVWENPTLHNLLVAGLPVVQHHQSAFIIGRRATVITASHPVHLTLYDEFTFHLLVEQNSIVIGIGVEVA